MTMLVDQAFNYARVTYDGDFEDGSAQSCLHFLNCMLHEDWDPIVRGRIVSTDSGDMLSMFFEDNSGVIMLIPNGSNAIEYFTFDDEERLFEYMTAIHKQGGLAGELVRACSIKLHNEQSNQEKGES